MSCMTLQWGLAFFSFYHSYLRAIIGNAASSHSLLTLPSLLLTTPSTINPPTLHLRLVLPPFLPSPKASSCSLDKDAIETPSRCTLTSFVRSSCLIDSCGIAVQCMVRLLFLYVKPVYTKSSLAHFSVHCFACISKAPLEFAYSFAIFTSTALSNSG